MTRVMGILNVTPDSFFDGGKWECPEEAAAQARRMEEEGAGALDIGGQSTRPGFAEISPEEEIARVLPVIRAVAPRAAIPLSIDTYKPAVAAAALGAGAGWLNDIRGLQGDPALARIAAEHGCVTVVMHHDPGFREGTGDLLERLRRYFDRSLAIASAAGIPASRLLLDPGIGFFKTPAQNLEILRRLPELRSFGLPLLVGVSRKSVIAHVLGGEAGGRLEGTLACTALAAQQGVDWVRVHDVAANARVIRMTEAIHAPA